MFEKCNVSQEEENPTPSASRPLRVTARGILKWMALGASILVVGVTMRVAAILILANIRPTTIEELLSKPALEEMWLYNLGFDIVGVGFTIVIFAIVIYIVLYLLGGLEESSENMPTVTPEEDGDATSY